MQSFLRSYFEALPGIEGWFSGEAALLFMAYNQLIAREKIAGDVLEIGVHHGKSAIAVARMRGKANRFYAVDLFENEQAENVSGSGSGDRRAFVDNMRPFGGLEQVQIIAGSSQKLKASELGRSFSFCHIDGGHSARETYLDMELCEQILLPGGLLALDDYFNDWFPGVSEGAARYMLEHSGALIPAAIGFNKVLFQKSGTDLKLGAAFRDSFDYIPRSSTQFWNASVDLFIAGLSGFIDLDDSTPERFVRSSTFPYSLVIEPALTATRASKSRVVDLPVRITNRSADSFPPGDALAGLSYHLLAPDGTVRRWDNPRVALAPGLEPDEERCLTVRIDAPPDPGDYVVELDVVWENVAWLKDRGSPTSAVRLTVTG